MKNYLLLLFLFTLFQNISAQTMFSRTGHINVSSENRIKKVEADNYQLYCSADLTNGELNFEGLLKSFEFKLGAADRIFNSSKVNVNEYPKFNYEGTFKPINIDLNNYGEYQIEVDGILYMWGMTRKTKATATITAVGDGKQIFAYTAFVMKIEEESMEMANRLMKQKLPSALSINTETLGISRDINVNLDVTLKKTNID